MNEDFIEETSDINPLGKWIIVGAVVLVVIAVVVGIMHTGVNLAPSGKEAIADQAATIDINKLDDEGRRQPPPGPTIGRTEVQVVESQLQASPAAAQSPAAQHTPDAMELWREQEAMKARDASPIVAAFEPKANTREIPNLAGQSRLQPPASPWTISEGTIINAILKFGVNSDYPGDLVAQIERPLYDSATGQHLLVPAGSMLTGKFQQPTGPFQERILIAWHRLILPNNWSMPLPEAPSIDGQGYAGVGGDVNHHYVSTFGSAALVSLLSIAGEVGSVLTFSSGATSPFTGGIYQTTPEQQLGSLAMSNAGMQMGSTGQRYLEPRLNRPNTVTIPPGTRFDVYVNADVVLPGPYSDNAGQLIDAQETK